MIGQWLANDWPMPDEGRTNGSEMPEQCSSTDWPVVDQCTQATSPRPFSGAQHRRRQAQLRAPAPRLNASAQRDICGMGTARSVAARCCVAAEQDQSGLSWPCLEAAGPWRTSTHADRACALPAFFLTCARVCSITHRPCFPCPSAALHAMSTYTDASSTLVTRRVTNESCVKGARATPCAAPRRRS